jgi:amino acid transporter
MRAHASRKPVDPPVHTADLAEDMCVHIFTTSAAMIGVCMTVVGVLHVVSVLRKVDTFGDDLLCINSLIYLASCLTAYGALRTRRRKRNRRLEWMADWLFLAGLVLSTIATAFITWAIAGS